MLKFLKGVVGGTGGGIKDLPYNIGEPYSTSWGSWVHHRGTSKEDGSAVSIFSLSGNNAQDGHLAAGRNGVKRLRTVRHPNILSFLHSTEVEVVDGSVVKPTIYIVTEPVMPLSEKIKELGLEGTQRDEYYSWGLHQIAKAVSFLNNDCKLVHGNVCVASVVVTSTLDWKLHAFDVLSEFDGNSESSTGPMLSLLPDYQRLLSSTPSRRLNPSKLDNSEYFQNKLVETIQFMEVLNLKDSVEKDTFFRKLPNLAEQLPRQIVLKKVLPTIIKLFASNDRAIRVSLLQHIDQFGASFTAQVVDEQVYPHVASGFSDTSAFLRELTLKSMLVLAPKLSQRSISGSLLKYLSKLQVDEEPAIRTNTTILLGNIANYLNDGTRKRVLINAFTVRALRDTFSPARAAGGVSKICKCGKLEEKFQDEKERNPFGSTWGTRI
ncbi:N-terminal kinase-like protein [Nymphaea thermarum]|nr:N-terminal kinase-like protein [Nymphaea thermarum]